MSERRIMKIHFLLATILVGHFAVGQNQTLSPTPKVGDMAPYFEKEGYAGQIVSLENTEAKVIILDFWASWCRPCIASVDKYLKPLYEKYDRSEVEIIGISNDRKETSWTNAIKSWDLTWPNNWDDDTRLVRAYGVLAIPTYFILDRDGKVLASNVYSRELKPAVATALKNLD